MALCENLNCLLTVNEKLLVRKQEANIVVLSVTKLICLLNIVTFCQYPLSFLQVSVSSLDFAERGAPGSCARESILEPDL